MDGGSERRFTLGGNPLDLNADAHHHSLRLGESRPRFAGTCTLTDAAAIIIIRVARSEVCVAFRPPYISVFWKGKSSLILQKMRLGGDFVQKRNGKWLILGGLRKKCTTPCMPVDGPISWMALFPPYHPVDGPWMVRLQTQDHPVGGPVCPGLLLGENRIRAALTPIL